MNMETTVQSSMYFFIGHKQKISILNKFLKNKVKYKYEGLNCRPTL